MDVQPDQVAEVMNQAGIESWGLMGLPGYVGYRNDPRMTQHVDVMVPYELKDNTKSAILKRWPKLQPRELEMVIRFDAPSETDRVGNTRTVLDMMLLWSPFQELILADHVIGDQETNHRLPTLEAALASKYAAMISSYRAVQKKATAPVTFVRWFVSIETSSTSNDCTS